MENVLKTRGRVSGRTKNRVQKNTTSSKKKGRVSLGRVLSLFFLVSFLTVSVTVLGYVIFFRTVVAAEREVIMGDEVSFEKPAQADDSRQKHHDAGKTDKPKVAIIIDDMGYNQERGQKFLDSSFLLNYAFLPYAPFTGELEVQAYQSGKTILLHLPMQPKSDEWEPEPGTLTLEMDEEAVRNCLAEELSRVPHAVGVNNHMGSRYTESRKRMREVVRYLKKKELFFIDSYTTPDSVGHEVAQQEKLKTARRHVFIDNIQNMEKICTQMRKLVELSKKQHFAIGIGHPYPETLIALESCGDEVFQGVDLVSVAELVR